MAARPTIKDVADAAGVSVATVDRVLNGRAKVREETARTVYEAAARIGYHASDLILHRMDANLPAVRLGFLLQRPEQPFYAGFAEALQKAARDNRTARITADVEFVAEPRAETFAQSILALGRQCDAVAATSIDHHAVTAAVQDLKEQGKPVFALLSDFAQGIRENYIGTNNMKVGRTAAWLLSRTARHSGKIALFVGSFRWHGHDLREAGFRSFFREHAPDFQVLDTLANLDTRNVTEEMIANLMRQHPDLAGIYLAGGGMEGALDALRTIPRDTLPSVVINELTPDSMMALQEHLVVGVISTPLEDLCRKLVSGMIASVLEGPATTPGQIFLPFRLDVPESV